MEADAPAPTASPAAGAEAIFEHVVVGIDDTPESLIAAAQAGVLRAPNGRLVLVAGAERYLAAHAGAAAADADDHLVAETSADLAWAKELVDADDAILASGRLVDLLCSECARRGATLLAVGVRPHRRLGALMFGGHEVDALHDARCSLLIARPGWGPHKPDRVVVAVDGSPEARAAERVARAVAARLGCDLLPVVGLADAVDVEVIRDEREDALLDPRSLVDAVANAGGTSSLVVVGRAPHEGGRRRSGSVAERIVYGARGSVLVVQHALAGPA